MFCHIYTTCMQLLYVGLKSDLKWDHSDESYYFKQYDSL